MPWTLLVVNFLDIDLDEFKDIASSNCPD